MMRLQELYNNFERAPFPKLGGQVGNFVLFDGYFSGYVRAVLRGEEPPPEQAMQPDDESAREIAALRSKETLTEAERNFLDYVDMMDAMRDAIYRST